MCIRLGEIKRKGGNVRSITGYIKKKETLLLFEVVYVFQLFERDK